MACVKVTDAKRQRICMPVLLWGSKHIKFYLLWGRMYLQTLPTLGYLEPEDNISFGHSKAVIHPDLLVQDCVAST